MSMCIFVLSTLIALYGVFMPTDGLEKDWTYTLQQITLTSTNPEIFDGNLRAVRVSAGVYGVKGSIFPHVDLDDEYMVEAKLYKSASGSSQYTATPFQVPKCTVTKFMNSAYKNFLLNDVKDCSDLPQFTDEWEPPLAAKEYILNSCIIGTDNFPTHMQPGFYKIDFKVTKDDFTLLAEIIAKVDAKSAMG